MLSGYRGELPEALLPGLGVQGSFDSVAASLRETATPLRMTVCFGHQVDEVGFPERRPGYFSEPKTHVYTSIMP